MIRVEQLTVKEFRGIHKLTLEPRGRNFAICGPNGTGKSGVVDALEFALTGDITRLTGEGTLGITVKSHGPHVDRRDTPELAEVVLQTMIPSSGKRLTIKRTIDAPAEPTIDPNDAGASEVVSELGNHPEFALSRRQIIKYILTPEGDRSKEIQALLRLDRVERVRQSLTTITNSLKKEGKRIDQDSTQAGTNLLRALGISQLREKDIIEAANQRRKILQLNALTELKADTSLKSGIAQPEKGAAASKISKKAALDDLLAFEKAASSPESNMVTASRSAVVDIIKKLLENPSLLRSLLREDFLRAGFDLIDVDSCPFCDVEWKVSELRARIQQKLEEAKQASAMKQTLEQSAKPLTTALLNMETLSDAIASYGPALVPPVDITSIASWTATIKLRRERISSLNNQGETIKELSQDFRQIPVNVLAAAALIRRGIEALPDPSKEGEANEYLTLCQERLDRFRDWKRKQQINRNQSEIATKALSAYNDATTAILDKVYGDVEQDFATYYRFINREDEPEFTGKLTPFPGKLSFDVDFYKRGYFPPGAYHSEGHQDAMGLCLYLALMKHTFGDKFTFAVLDDVLMSVDAGHRREVCKLLRKEFPGTQFILTTHDPVWLKHMVTEKVIEPNAYIQFRKWTIDEGPLVWNGADVWQEVTNHLGTNDVSQASHTLRVYLEYISAELAERLRVKLEYRSDGRYDLGQLLPPVVSEWKQLLKKAKEAANSWGKKDDIERLSIMQQEINERYERSQAEQWAINSTIHYNNWVNLQREEFRSVASAFKELLECFVCNSCGAFAHVTPPIGHREAVRCNCGEMMNLKAKP